MYGKERLIKITKLSPTVSLQIHLCAQHSLSGCWNPHSKIIHTCIYASRIWVCFGVNQLILSQLKSEWDSGISLHARFYFICQSEPSNTTLAALKSPTLSYQCVLLCMSNVLHLTLALSHSWAVTPSSCCFKYFQHRKETLIILPYRGPRGGPSQAQCSTSRTQSM